MIDRKKADSYLESISGYIAKQVKTEIEKLISVKDKLKECENPSLHLNTLTDCDIDWSTKTGTKAGKYRLDFNSVQPGVSFSIEGHSYPNTTVWVEAFYCLDTDPSEDLDVSYDEMLSLIYWPADEEFDHLKEIIDILTKTERKKNETRHG